MVSQFTFQARKVAGTFEKRAPWTNREKQATQHASGRVRKGYIGSMYHPDKCKVLRIGRERNFVRHEYMGKTLPSAESASYLGVTTTKDLNWNEHVNRTSDKADKTAGFLRRNPRICSPVLKTLAYSTFVRPTVDYTAIVWDPYTKTNIDKIEIVVRRKGCSLCPE